MKKIASILAALIMAATTAVCAYAASGTGFVGSVEQKPAPEIQTGTTVNVNGEEIPVDELANQNMVMMITPLSEKMGAQNPAITEKLDKAQKELSDTDSSEMNFTSDADLQKFNELNDDAASRNKKIVASNVFDVSLLNDNKDIVAVSGMTVKLAVGDANSTVMVMQNADGKWSVIPFTDNGDGTITLTLPSNGVVALFTETDATTSSGGDNSGSSSSSQTGSSSGSGSSSSGGKVTSPNTGAGSKGILLISAAAVTAAGAVVCLKRSKRS